MVAEKLSKGKKKEITVRDVGGVHELAIAIQPGVNVLSGPNGSGKTSTIAAISRALGGDAKIERRDGTAKGVVEVDGVTLTVKSVARASGEATVELADVGPLADLIDPQIDDPEKAAAARLKALLRLTPMPVDETLVREIAGHDAVAEHVCQEFREGATTDLLATAERCRIVGHRLAREAEAEADRLEGAAGAGAQRLQAAIEKLGGEEGVVETTAAQAEAAGHEAAQKLAVAEHALRQRLELERRQADARSQVGETPNPLRFDADLELREEAVRAHERRLHELDVQAVQIQAQIAKEREAMAGVKADLRALDAAKRAEGERLEQHRKLVAVLEEPVTGPTAEEVEAFELAVEQAKATYRTARFSDEVRAAQAETEAAGEKVKEAKRRAERLREAATTIGWRIGDALTKYGVHGLTVVDGRLAAVENGETFDFATRRSEGQRIAAALRLAARVYSGKVVPLAGHLWQALDDTHRAELSRLATELGLYLVTEQPADGELRVEHVQPSDVAEAAEVAA